MMTKIVLKIRRLALSHAVLAASLLPALYAAPAHAQNRHSWVSHSGNDGNPCTFGSPCATIGQALSQTDDGGGVTCLDSGIFSYYDVTITVTIDCAGTVATPDLSTGVACPAIRINAPGKVVILRGLNVTNFAPFSCLGNGIEILAATAVQIEDCVIDHWQKGIIDARTTGLTKLAIKNTVVRNSAFAGIVVAAAPKNSVVLENVQSIDNAYGIGVAAGNNVVINRSVMSENSIAGIEVDAGGTVFVDNSEISHNASYGIFSQGLVSLSNSDISFNTSSLAGSVLSYGNNRIFSNGPGNAPSLIAQQ